ncbi:mitogen-activated protein kinase kinase kinase 19 isoform X2 [Sceloporus undulatus]|nr:mitogen-activated protein kinase kinase kinase 19 isoform X2 [Sceloporus undulatus]
MVTPVTFHPVRMVHLPSLKENAKKKTDSNAFPCISNPHSFPAKHIDSQSDEWQRDQSERQIPSTVTDAFSLTTDPHTFNVDNHYISSGYSEVQETEIQLTCNNLDADIKNKVSCSKMHDVSVTIKTLSMINKDCGLDNTNNCFSSSETVPILAKECEHYPSKHPETLKVSNQRNYLANKSSLNLHSNKTELSEVSPNHNINNVMNIEHGNNDGDSSLQSKNTEQHALRTTVPNALMDLEQSGRSSCPVADIKVMESVPVSHVTESNFTEVAPIVNIIYGHKKPTQVSRHSAPRKSKPSNLSQSFNIFAYKDSDRNKVNSSKSDSALKGKVCIKMSQDFIILGKSSIQCQANKKKNSNSDSLGLSCEETGISSKSKKRHLQQKKHHFNQISQKSPEQVLPSISNTSVTSGETNTPLPFKQAHLSKDSMDLKYSDMFKEINSSDKGPGIYEMFATPVYTREPDRHENMYCRNVHSAPAGRRNATKHKSNHFSGKTSSRIRNTPKKTYPKSHKIPFGTKQKKKDLVPKEASELESSSLVKVENGIISSAEGQIKIEGDIYEDVDQQVLLSTELAKSAKQKEILPRSNLSTIEEVSLEYTSNVDVNKKFVTSVQELLWPEVKVHAEYAPFLSCVKDNNEHINAVESRNRRQVESEATTSLVETKASQVLCCGDKQEKPSELSFPEAVDSLCLQNLQPGNISSANLPPQWPCYPADSISQTYPNTLSYEMGEVAEDLFCCSVAELLSLGGADNNCSEAVAKHASAEVSNGTADSKNDSTAIVRNRKNICPDFLEPSRGNRFQNVTAFVENSLTDEDTVMWTKGEILGKGAYGIVYCGLTNQGHLIAVKQVPLNIYDQTGNEKEYQKLQEEVEILKNLTHINIVGYLGTGLEDNIVSIFMEFVPGGSISSIIHRFGPLPEIVFCKYTKQIVQGVAYLHENGVVHRDIKGNNIMLMPNGIIKLIDFGCAKRLACISLTNTHSEPLKSVHGTPYWMAPEVINESGYGRKSDVWSIGCTVFEMATGKPPLASMDRIAAMFYIGAHRGLMPSLPKHCSKKATDFVHLCLTR